MIHYLDRSFCISPNCKNKCGRKLTPQIMAAAYDWWGGPDAPICMGYFCGPPENKDDDDSKDTA